MKKKNKKETIDLIASIIGEGVHTGLRKFSDHKKSSVAWDAIAAINDGSWDTICNIVAEQVYNSL